MNVGVCFTMILPNGVNTFDGSWFSALNAVESEIPTFTTPFAVGYSKIAVELNFQDGIWTFFNEDAILYQPIVSVVFQRLPRALFPFL